MFSIRTSLCNPFFMFRCRLHYVWQCQRQKKCMEVLNINQGNNLLILCINHIIPSVLVMIFWQGGLAYMYEYIMTDYLVYNVFFVCHVFSKAASSFKQSRPASLTKPHFSDYLVQHEVSTISMTGC